MRGASWALAIALVGCAGAEGGASMENASPAPIGEHECASCGMIVREQPSPRAQLIHRDGTRAWFCSIADVVAYEAAPSRHGRIERTWVEVLPPELDPAVNDAAERPWIEADRVHFVLGVPRDLIMGTPALAYGSEGDARGAMERVGGRAARWDEVRRELGGPR